MTPPPPDGFIQLEELPFYPRPLPAALSNRKNCLFEPAPSRWFYPIGGTAVLSPPLSGGFIQSEKAFFGLGIPPSPAPSLWLYPIGRTAFLSPPPPGGFIQSRNCRFIPAPFRWFYPIGGTVLWARLTTSPAPSRWLHIMAGTAVLAPPPPSGFIQSEKLILLFPPLLGPPTCNPAPFVWVYPIGGTVLLAPPPPAGFIQSEELHSWPRPIPEASSNWTKHPLAPPPPGGFTQSGHASF